MLCQPIKYGEQGGMNLYRCAKCRCSWSDSYGETPVCYFRPDNVPVEHKPVIEIDEPYTPPDFNEDAMLPAKHLAEMEAEKHHFLFNAFRR